MSTDDLTPKTKREVLIAREAFVKACIRAIEHFGWGYREPRYATWPGARKLAESIYPLPTVTRPRTITVAKHEVEGTEYNAATFRALNGRIEYRSEFSGKWIVSNKDATAQRVAAWADLLKDPTETVEDDTP